MLNRQPIFINALAGSGSNLLWNLLQSHPEVCSPGLETHQLLCPGTAGPLRGRALAALGCPPGFFDRRALGPRAPLPRVAAAAVDTILFLAKLQTLRDPYNRFRAEGRPYTLGEVFRSRLVSKNLDGLVCCTPALLRAYPDATFFGLVRDPVALYDSYRRRGLAATAEAFARTYLVLARQLLSDAREHPRCHLLRFEELAADPAALVDRLYGLAGLARAPAQRVRLKVKPHLDACGDRAAPLPAGTKVWLGLDQLRGFIEPRINAFHGQRVSAAEQRAIRAGAGPVLAPLGYDR